MFTEMALDNFIQEFLICLQTEAGYSIEKAGLLGSYVKASVKPTSDIDLAIWTSSFEGSLFSGLPPKVGIVSKFHPISIRPFPEKTTSMDFPFTEEIEKRGINIEIPKPGKKQPDLEGERNKC